MAGTSERTLVLIEVGFSIVFAVVGGLTAWMVGVPAEGWLVGAATAVVFAVTDGLYDRGRVGRRASYAAGTSVMLVALAGLYTDWIPIDVVPPMTIGLATGVGLNRLVFGVLRPLPSERRRRLENAE
jgi:hypothetical protein